MKVDGIYINKKAKFVSVGEAVCNSNNRALFERMGLSMDIGEAMDSLSKPLEFGNKDQIMALQAYQAMAIWHENFYH